MNTVNTDVWEKDANNEPRWEISRGYYGDPDEFVDTERREVYGAHAVIELLNAAFPRGAKLPVAFEKPEST